MNQRYAYLLAFLIAFQNLPEGFNAYREITSAQQSAPASLAVQTIKLAKIAKLLELGLRLAEIFGKPLLISFADDAMTFNEKIKRKVVQIWKQFFFQANSPRYAQKKFKLLRE